MKWKVLFTPDDEKVQENILNDINLTLAHMILITEENKWNNSGNKWEGS